MRDKQTYQITTAWVSDTQRYKMLGNWWTVDVIAHIFRFILSSDK